MSYSGQPSKVASDRANAANAVFRAAAIRRVPCPITLGGAIGYCGLRIELWLKRHMTRYTDDDDDVDKGASPFVDRPSATARAAAAFASIELAAVVAYDLGRPRSPPLLPDFWSNFLTRRTKSFTKAERAKPCVPAGI